MERAGSKEVRADKSREEVDRQMSSQPSTSFAKSPAKGKKQRKTVKDNDCKPKEEAGDAETPRPARRKPDLKNIPDTPKEARVKTFRKKMKTEEGEVPCPQMAVPLEVVPVPVPEEQVPALTEPPVLFEEVSTTVVTTTASEAVLASWARIAANAKKNEAVPSTATSETYGEMWCVVHGRSLPAQSSGWVRLQFHAGQAWVPEKKGKVIALFLLPACNFPPPHLEDNMLCPKCVHRNRILNKSLHG
ncbi:developmental pluripotency-associated protein 4 isoform X2 [Peromyscus californicus insignis]|uniref:developmental pluripotency-associated protein 4 isoform X2 n=1 Tax=Peromyscus californicus insignis TaxID=564181 RepID=UPI0022A796BC|nr:developmental pluripotency-associated protein 4 isoform X2 [Peromyscus californicus insignis]